MDSFASESNKSVESRTSRGFVNNRPYKILLGLLSRVGKHL
jgi:hypothetical protein